MVIHDIFIATEKFCDDCMVSLQYKPNTKIALKWSLKMETVILRKISFGNIKWKRSFSESGVFMWK